MLGMSTTNTMTSDISNNTTIIKQQQSDPQTTQSEYTQINDIKNINKHENNMVHLFEQIARETTIHYQNDMEQANYENENHDEEDDEDDEDEDENDSNNVWQENEEKEEENEERDEFNINLHNMDEKKENENRKNSNENINININYDILNDERNHETGGMIQYNMHQSMTNNNFANNKTHNSYNYSINSVKQQTSNNTVNTHITGVSVLSSVPSLINVKLSPALKLQRNQTVESDDVSLTFQIYDENQ